MANVAQGVPPRQQRLFTWEQGRQESGYWKFLIARKEPLFDVYLLKYPEGAQIPKHRDPVFGRRHYRCNILLKKAKLGGVFKCDSCYRFGPIVVFASDRCWHEVSRIEAGTRWVLSIGVSFKG